MKNFPFRVQLTAVLQFQSVMPRKKVPKRKVKEVTLPDGDEGCDLPVEAKKFKLESFIEQFDYEGNVYYSIVLP